MGIHLLIIEAGDRFRPNLTQRLRREGFAVAEVTQNADIEAILRSERIDVVLLGVDGLGREALALIGRIKTVDAIIEIIMINDSRHMDLSIEGMKLGAFDDFMIPFDIDSLVIRIHEAGRRKQRNG